MLRWAGEGCQPTKVPAQTLHAEFEACGASTSGPQTTLIGPLLKVKEQQQQHLVGRHGRAYSMSLSTAESSAEVLN